MNALNEVDPIAFQWMVACWTGYGQVRGCARDKLEVYEVNDDDAEFFGLYLQQKQTGLHLWISDHPTRYDASLALADLYRRIADMNDTGVIASDIEKEDIRNHWWYYELDFKDDGSVMARQRNTNAPWKPLYTKEQLVAHVKFMRDIRDASTPRSGRGRPEL